MDPALDAHLYAELARNREWFAWHVEALVAAGVLMPHEGEEWRARPTTVSPPPADVIQRAAALEYDRAQAGELFKARLIGPEQLRAVLERDGTDWDDSAPPLGEVQRVICDERAVLGDERILAVVVYERGVVAHLDDHISLAVADDAGTSYARVDLNTWTPAPPPAARTLELFTEHASVEVGL